jgi:ribonucrease Y
MSWADPAMLMAFAGALLVGAAVAFVLGRMVRGRAGLEVEEERRRVLEAARLDAQVIARQAGLQAREVAERLRAEVDADIGARRLELERRAAELAARAAAAERREREIDGQRAEVAELEKQLAGREQAAEAALRAAAAQAEQARERLERVAGLSAAEARQQLEDELRAEAQRAAAAAVRHIEEEARALAADRARVLLAAAVQRQASDYVVERTVAVVTLPSDDMKGRIIGREGRNIRALEAATGVDIIIDDTPEAVVISCFHPVRREIARLALTSLIADGRIHPARIEEMVAKASAEVDRQGLEAAEQAVFDLGVGRLPLELLRLLGRLKFATSNTQNLLQHSIEVAFLAGALGAELGLPTRLARRAGLLHDIGKAADHELEGAHAVVGAQLLRKHGEEAALCRAVESHHGDVEPESALDHVVDAANVLSGQRPGARREMLETYVQRLQDLERIAASFAGVQRAFAIQAGREVRVLVENASVSDEEARALSRNIARRVEAELAYPGQVRVAVVRETRATDYAR